MNTLIVSFIGLELFLIINTALVVKMPQFRRIIRLQIRAASILLRSIKDKTNKEKVYILDSPNGSLDLSLRATGGAFYARASDSVVIGSYMLEDLTHSELEAVIAHELTHKRHKDSHISFGICHGVFKEIRADYGAAKKQGALNMLRALLKMYRGHLNRAPMELAVISGGMKILKVLGLCQTLVLVVIPRIISLLVLSFIYKA